MDLLSGLMQVFPLPLAVLLAGGMVLPFIGLLAERVGFEKLREGFALIVLASGLLSVYPFYGQVMEAVDQNQTLVFSLSEWLPPASSCFEVDMLGVFMSFSVLFLGVLACVYSIKYMEKESRLTEYYTLLTLMISGMIGIALSGDFFTLFIFWEMMCISSYILVAFLKERWGPIEAGLKYLIMSAAGGAFLLFSMSFLYGLTGTLNFAELASSLLGQTPNTWFLVVLSLLIIGFGVKSAIVPLHTWLPDAHPEAPSPISAMLSGVVIETGLYGLCRVLFILFDPSLFRPVIAGLAVLTMTVGNVMALLQPDIKRLLAYSSIAQIGYMLIGFSSGTAYGLLGLFLHVFNHSLMKGLAFLSSGSIVHRTETREISRLKGIGRAMPITTFALFIALLGLGGVPATNGFVSKFILFGSALEPGVNLWWLAIAGVLNSAFSMAYYLRVMKTLISEPEEVEVVKEAPASMLAVTVLMAALIVFFGIFPTQILGFAGEASKSLTENLGSYIRTIMGAGG